MHNENTEQCVLEQQVSQVGNQSFLFIDAND